jgi:SAC3 family protein LENG8/THP3
VVIVNGGGSSDLLKTMLSVTHSQQQQDPIIRHALAVRRASSGGDYHAFFRLYKKCPTVWSEYLMDGLVPAVRFDGLKCIAKSYRPAPVAVDFVLQQLGLLQQRGDEDDDDDERDEEELTYGRNWLVSCGCKLSKDGADVLTIETEVHQSTMDEKQSLI